MKVDKLSSIEVKTKLSHQAKDMDYSESKRRRFTIAYHVMTENGGGAVHYNIANIAQVKPEK